MGVSFGVLGVVTGTLAVEMDVFWLWAWNSAADGHNPL